MTVAQRNGRAMGDTIDLQSVTRTAIRTATVELTGDYEGWSAVMRINPPNRIWKEFSSGEQERFRAALAAIVVDWNFVDDDGNALTLPKDGLDWDEVPFNLETAMVDGYTTEMRKRTEVPKETSTTSEPTQQNAT